MPASGPGCPEVCGLIALEGDQVPVAPLGTTFGHDCLIRACTVATELTINSSGHIAFMASLSDVTNGIWGTDINGQLQRGRADGRNTASDAAGDFRTVELRCQLLGGSGNSDGRPSGFSDNGQVAFLASFTDGSSGIVRIERVGRAGAADVCTCPCRGRDRPCCHTEKISDHACRCAPASQHFSRAHGPRWRLRAGRSPQSLSPAPKARASCPAIRSWPSPPIGRTGISDSRRRSTPKDRSHFTVS